MVPPETEWPFKQWYELKRTGFDLLQISGFSMIGLVRVFFRLIFHQQEKVENRSRGCIAGKMSPFAITAWLMPEASVNPKSA